MTKTSCDSGPDSGRPETEDPNREKQDSCEEQSDYYYDDATGYEIYQDDEEDDHE